MSVKVNAYWQQPPDRIVARVRAWLKRLLYGVVYLAEAYARHMEDYAKLNRRWTDRTGHARGGLTGRLRTLEAGHVQAVIGHTMEYGIWLEVRWDGRYGILLRTLRHHKPLFWQDFTALVFDF